MESSLRRTHWGLGIICRSNDIPGSIFVFPSRRNACPNSCKTERILLAPRVISLSISKRFALVSCDWYTGKAAYQGQKGTEWILLEGPSLSIFCLFSEIFRLRRQRYNAFRRGIRRRSKRRNPWEYDQVLWSRMVCSENSNPILRDYAGGQYKAKNIWKGAYIHIRELHTCKKLIHIFMMAKLPNVPVAALFIPDIDRNALVMITRGLSAGISSMYCLTLAIDCTAVSASFLMQISTSKAPRITVRSVSPKLLHLTIKINKPSRYVVLNLIIGTLAWKILVTFVVTFLERSIWPILPNSLIFFPPFSGTLLLKSTTRSRSLY